MVEGIICRRCSKVISKPSISKRPDFKNGGKLTKHLTFDKE